MQHSGNLERGRVWNPPLQASMLIFYKQITPKSVIIRKIVLASYYFRDPELNGCEESLRALRFRCERGVKGFSQRAQRLTR